MELMGKLVFIVCISGFSILKHRSKCLYTVQNIWLLAALFAKNKNEFSALGDFQNYSAT